ncbi:MAG: PilZ domain-containing protein [Candidatus Tritonobacter lacicola]|nr:PilZ domain-containing protein [Candidatus Tritonobacter lacicola]
MKMEKRRAPRVRVRVPVKLAAKGGRDPISARTLDLSYSGAYCRVGRFIPLNSEVDVELGLPGSDVLCKGIVVRNKKRSGGDQYGIALFFSDISDSGQRHIVDFIDGRLQSAGIKPRSARKKVRDFIGEKSYVSRRKGLEVNSAKFRVLKGDVAISSNGLSCQVDRKVPLFKEIAVNIVLPSEKRPGTVEAIQCSGVVVSCDKVRGKDCYDLAIYFEGLPGKTRARIDSFTRSGEKAAVTGR